jgi:hypothetical protein
MTQPTPPTPSHDRKFARDVARQIDRRRTRRRLTVWTALLALVIAAASYLRFGGGLGTLGLGGGRGDGDEQSRTLAGPERCAIRISASDLTVNGRPTARDAAIAACKVAPGVDIFPTGDVRHGDVEALEAAIKAAGVKDVVLHPLPRRSPDAPSGTPSAPAGSGPGSARP